MRRGWSGELNGNLAIRAFHGGNATVQPARMAARRDLCGRSVDAGGQRGQVAAPAGRRAAPARVGGKYGGGAVKLERYRTYTLWDEEGNPLDERPRSVVRVFDVLEWRDSIRAAVVAEREAEWRHVCAILDDSPVTTGGGPTYPTSRAVTDARAALDALLADGGE